MNHFSENIFFLREKQNWSRKQLEISAGLPEGAVENFEKNINEPTLGQLINLSKVFNTDLNRLVTFSFTDADKKLKNFEFKFLALDIDGVLTDAGMYYTQSGDEFKKFNAKDGLAIKTLTAEGKNVGFISSGINSTIIENRATLLGVQKVYVGTWKKAEILDQWCKELNILMENIAYIGDDVNDLPAIEKCGLTACPADAADAVIARVDFVLSSKGGEGCVREFVEMAIMKIK